LRHELDLPPLYAIQTTRVIIAVAAELPHAAVFGRKLVPLLTGHLAGLTANAYRGVGVKSHCLGHYALSTLHTKALPSWIDTFGSPTRTVSSFTTSAVTTPCQPQ